MAKPPGRNDNMRWRAARAAAIVASGGMCQLCGQPLGPDAPHNSPAETCVDHVTPLYLGGAPYDLANILPLTTGC